MKAKDSTPGSSTSKAKNGKPLFPLFQHATGQWAKKVNGRLHYFGKDKDKALAEWVRVKDALLAGRPRPAETTADSKLITVRELCNLFLEFKDGLVETGELERRSFADYQVECMRMIEILGSTTPVDVLDQADFRRLRLALSRNAENQGRVSQKTLEGRVARCRAVFRYGELTRNTGPVLYKMIFEFKKPSKKAISKERGESRKVFDASEIRVLLSNAGVNLKAMIMLGINAGLGNTDIAELTLEHFDFDSGWMVKNRKKTGTPRRCPLWPETIEAIQAAISIRKSSVKDCPFIFLTKQGNPFVQPPKQRQDENEKTRWSIGSNPISSEFRKLRTSCGIDGAKQSFYALRHSFKTVGENATGNNIAVDYLMGHLDESVSGMYRQYILDERLLEVTNAVHKWLFAPPSKPPKRAY
jgi:integrase